MPNKPGSNCPHARHARPTKVAARGTADWLRFQTGGKYAVAYCPVCCCHFPLRVRRRTIRRRSSATLMAVA